MRAIVRVGLPDLVRTIEQSGAIATFVTTLRPGGTALNGVVTVDVNLLLYSFGLPLFAALTLAARERAWKRHLGVGYVALQPFIAWGVLADFLKNVAITAGPAVASQTGFAGWQREAIAFAFQFGSLILPAVAPVGAVGCAARPVPGGAAPSPRIAGKRDAVPLRRRVADRAFSCELALAQHLALHLAGRRHRQRVDEFDLLRILVRREMLADVLLRCRLRALPTARVRVPAR